MTGQWIVMWMETDVDGLAVRMSARPEDRHTRTIHTADVHEAESGEWLATAFRLQFGEDGAGIYGNYRRRAELEPRRMLLLKAVFEFQAAIWAGEANTCMQ